jgi:hypothetical protein
MEWEEWRAHHGESSSTTMGSGPKPIDEFGGIQQEVEWGPEPNK